MSFTKIFSQYRLTIISFITLLYILSFFLPFVVSLKVFLAGLLSVCAFFLTSLKEKKELLKNRPALWFMGSFFILLVISGFLLSDNIDFAKKSLQLRLPLLLFPLTLGLITLSERVRDKILLGIAIIVTISCLASLLYSIYQSVKFNDKAWLYNDAVSFFIGQQSIYTSLLVNISIYILGYFLLFSNQYSRYKRLFLISIIFLLGFSYMLASRNMMLALCATIFIVTFVYIFKRKKYLKGFSLLLGLLLSFFMIYKFLPNTINRFKEMAYTQFDYQSGGVESHYAGTLTADQWNGANFRLAAWPCAWQLYKENPWLGVGLGDKADELNEVYAQRQFQFAIDTQKNVHNNYLDILFSLGSIGFVFFIMGWIFLPLICFIKSKDWLALFILFTFASAMFTEVYFDRSIGGLLFGFFIPFLMAGSSINRMPKPKEEVQ